MLALISLFTIGSTAPVMPLSVKDFLAAPQIAGFRVGSPTGPVVTDEQVSAVMDCLYGNPATAPNAFRGVAGMPNTMPINTKALEDVAMKEGVAADVTCEAGKFPCALFVIEALLRREQTAARIKHKGRGQYVRLI